MPQDPNTPHGPEDPRAGQTPPPAPEPRRLTRSTHDKVVGGVAGGLGRYFNVDPIVFRVAFGVSVLFGGLGVIAYLALLAFLPTDAGEPPAFSRPTRPASIAIAVALAVAALAFLGPPLFVFGPGLLALALLGVVGVLLWRALGGEPGSDPARTVARATLALLILVAALGAAVGVGFLAAFGGGTVIAGLAVLAGLALIGVGLLGGPRWLILPVIVLVLPLAIVTAAGIDLHGGAGERVYRPASVADVKPKYELGAGRLALDLRDVQLPPGRTDVKLDLGIGEAVVRVPQGACVVSDAHIGAGLADLLDRTDQGADIDVAEAAPPTGRPLLHVDAHVGLGHLQVTRDGFGSPGCP
jgi:phage shock protein PspC (stress-responsive transcriptional regulator)